MIELELKYIANGVYNISRRHQGGFMPERLCNVDRKNNEELHTYYDGVSFETHLYRTHDEYSQLLVSVCVPVKDGQLVDPDVRLSYKTEAPVLVTFRCEEGYAETMSTEGGVSRECRVGDSGHFEWRQGVYTR